MAWLDDRIQTHPKIVDLSDRAHRAWINTLCYCSMHGTGGQLGAAIKVHRVTKPVIRELVRAGVWDEEADGELWIHDWQEHNEKRDNRVEEKRAQARERQRRHREKVKESRAVTRDVTRDSHAEVTRDKERDKSVTSHAGVRAPARARARARVGAPLLDHDHDQEPEPTSAVDAAHANGTSPSEQHTIEEDDRAPDEPRVRPLIEKTTAGLKDIEP